MTEALTLSSHMAGASEATALLPGQIRVAIVDDDREVCLGLAALINGSPGFLCVAACHTAEEALVGLPTGQPDIVLMDIGLPGMSGISLIPKLKERLPQAQIMMLTVFDDHDRIFEALRAGATGYLLKKTDLPRLLQNIRELYAGGSPMSNQIARRVVEEFQRQPAQAPDPAGQLTDREKEVLSKLAQGFLYKEIAESLNISIETVRTHVRNVYSKLEVRSRVQALNKVFPGRKRS